MATTASHPRFLSLSRVTERSVDSQLGASCHHQPHPPAPGPFRRSCGDWTGCFSATYPRQVPGLAFLVGMYGFCAQGIVYQFHTYSECLLTHNCSVPTGPLGKEEAFNRPAKHGRAMQGAPLPRTQSNHTRLTTACQLPRRHPDLWLNIALVSSSVLIASASIIGAVSVAMRHLYCNIRWGEPRPLVPVGCLYCICCFNLVRA